MVALDTPPSAQLPPTPTLLALRACWSSMPFLSIRTVEVPVDHILTRLDFRTRTQLAAWAHEEGLRPEDE